MEKSLFEQGRRSMLNRFGCCFVLLAGLLVATGCQSEEPASGSAAASLDVPVAPGSGQPRLYSGDEGTVWMSWLDPVDDGAHALRYATVDDTTWTDPTTVATGTDWFVNWADLPSVRPLPNGRVAAHYLESNGSSALAYAVRITQRTANGTWREAVTPHRDGTPTEHGFVSMLPWNEEALLALWLDGRKMEGGHSGEMTLRSAVLDTTGAVTHRSLVDGRTCECCGTSAVRVEDEALVAYRDRSEDEVRDILLARFDGETWSEPTPLHDDGWTIEGCPVNGPALAAKDDRVVAAWFTAAGGTPRVKVAHSSDGGHRFTEPVVVVEGNTMGRVDAVLLDDGTALVSWLEEFEDRGRVRVQSVQSDGTVGTATTLATLPSADRGVGFPKIAEGNGALYAVWVGEDEASEASRVKGVRRDIQTVR